MRLIDADALKANFEANVPAFAQEMIPGIFYIIDRAKTIDAEPQIIRCKDCKYYEEINQPYPQMYCRKRSIDTLDDDDFCSWAERRQDGKR